MKKTVTTILSLALAMILVSSLSSGTAYASKERKVVILDCGPDPFEPGLRPLVVTGFQSSTADDFGITVGAFMESSPTTCAGGIAIMLDNKFKMEDVDAFLHQVFVTLFSRYTFVKK